MEGGQVAHYRVPQIGQRFAGQLVEVVDNLAVLARNAPGGEGVPLCPSASWQQRASLQHRHCSPPAYRVSSSMRLPVPYHQHISTNDLSSLSSCIPTSGTAPDTGAPALSVHDRPPTTWCYAQPIQARMRAGHRWRPWFVCCGRVGCLKAGRGARLSSGHAMVRVNKKASSVSGRAGAREAAVGSDVRGEGRGYNGYGGLLEQESCSCQTK
jgi:hypothetical protein